MYALTPNSIQEELFDNLTTPASLLASTPQCRSGIRVRAESVQKAQRSAPKYPTTQRTLRISEPHNPGSRPHTNRWGFFPASDYTRSEGGSGAQGTKGFQPVRYFLHDVAGIAKSLTHAPLTYATDRDQCTPSGGRFPHRHGLEIPGPGFGIQRPLQIGRAHV